MWTSYLVGMRLPGKRAMFWHLLLDFAAGHFRHQFPLAYAARVSKFELRYGVLDTCAELSSGGRAFAKAQMRAFVRAPSPIPSPKIMEAVLPTSNLLRGRVALVIGGSRGLGAAISQALALQGCTVVLNYQSSTAEAESVKISVRQFPGTIELARGDASDLHWCQQLRDRIETTYGGLDILICNACPPIQPLGFVAETVRRFQDFVSEALNLVIVPMVVFLDKVNDKHGWSVLVSSEFVRTVPPEWPQYVTAKCAVEGFARWAAARWRQTRFLLVRPSKLLTDQTNTPLGREGATPTEQVAARIVSCLCPAVSFEASEFLEEL
jgi:NAD(P)-dependent dehydrogenase (short-subunit alcohol dehydrogenase family)